jgi:hypothetical protein
VNDVGAGDRVDQPFRERDLRLVQEVVRRAARQLRIDRSGDRRMRMPEQRGAGRQMKVEILASRDIPDPGAFAACDHQIEPRREHEQPEATAGEIAAGVFEQRALALDVRGAPRRVVHRLTGGGTV